MNNILLIILVFFLHSCHNSNAKPLELKQLNERITRLEQKMDSLTRGPNTGSEGMNNMSPTWQSDHCAAITKKGTPCRRKAGSNGYCWQHER